jgi:hypothetical protein
MRIEFDSDAVARASAKRLQVLLNEGRDEGLIGPLKHGQAQRLTAVVLGYAAWAELLKIAGTANPSLLDEELDVLELRARRTAQAIRLQQDRSLPIEIAEAFIDVWCPSMGPAAYNSQYAEEDDDDDSFPGMDAFRLAHPSDVNFGVDLCKGLGWPILSAGDDPEFGMASVFTYGSQPNKPVPIFVSALAYLPGDEDDAQAKQQRQQVARVMTSFPGTPGACIVYQHPMLSGDYVFFGAVFRNQKWLDMAWSSALASVDVLFEWADKGWDLRSRHPDTADKDGKLSSLARQCMENSYRRTMGEL